MKKIKQLVTICSLALAFTFASCSSDNDGNGGSVLAGDGLVTAKVDGTTVTSTKELTQASLVTGQLSSLLIQGTNLQGDGFYITITGYDGAKTYEIGGENTIFAVCSYIDTDLNNPTQPNIWTGPYDEAGQVVGQVVVTEATDTRVKGTFSFTGKNVENNSLKTVTDGSFNVALTNF